MLVQSNANVYLVMVQYDTYHVDQLDASTFYHDVLHLDHHECVYGCDNNLF